MTYRAAGASNRNIRFVRSVEYLTTATDIVATVNQHQLVGRYPTIEAAELAVEGILIKCGVKNTNEALFRIPTTILNSGGDSISTLNFSNFSAIIPISSAGTQFQLTDITRPICLLFNNSNRNIQCFVKVSSSTIPTNDFVDPELDGYTNTTNIVNVVGNPNDFIRIKAKWIGPSGFGILGTTNLTITNKQDNFNKVILITAEQL
jgi:hypothetical protein